MNKNMRKSLRKTKPKHAGPSVDNSGESTQVVLEPRRSFWKSFSNIFKCSTKRRRIPDLEENEQANILPAQTLPPIMEVSDSTDTGQEDIDDMKTILKKYSISPNSISMVQRIDRNDESKNVSKQSSLTGYVTDVSASSSDEEESARKKVLLKNKINEFKHEIIREESIKREEKCDDDDRANATMKKTDYMARSLSLLTIDKDAYSFDYSESSQQSMMDGNEEKADKVMFDNNIKVKDENDIVTVDSINDASQQLRVNEDHTGDESYDEDLEENVNYDTLKHEEKVALIEEQYNIALCTVNKIEEQITAYSKHLESIRSKSSTDDVTEQSMELENRDALQNAMKVFGTKIMDNQGSNLLRHLHDMHQKHSETMQTNAVSLDEPAAKSKPMNMQMECRRKFGFEIPHFTAGRPSRLDDGNDEEIQDNCTSSSESLNEVEVWSKDLNSIVKYIDRRKLPMFSKFENCPVNADGYKMLRLNGLFVAVAHPVSLKYKVVYDPIVDDARQHQYGGNGSHLVTHKHKYMSLVQPEAMYEEDSVESLDKETETYGTNEEKWETCTNETNESLTQENDADVTDDEDSDWKTVELEETDVNSLTNTEDSHEEYVNQQNRYNLMTALPQAGTKCSNPPVEFKVTLRNPHKENLVREYVAYRNVKHQVDRSTSYSSLPAAADAGMELLYKNQDAQSEESTSVTARVEDNEISMTFRNINDDVEHMINDLLIDVSELKDGCMEITDGLCAEPMVELKQTSNGVTSCIDTSSRISEALAQTIIHEILEDVFYFSEEHVVSEAGTEDELLQETCDTEIVELTDHDKCEDMLEGAYTYMRKDDRSKVFRNLDEVMQDLADETILDERKMNIEMEEEYCTCPSSMEELHIQRVNDEKLRLVQVQSILQHMLQREANKRQSRGVENTYPNVAKPVHLYDQHSCRKSTNLDAGSNEQTVLTDNSPAGCNYHCFFNNNFSIKSGFIGTPNTTMFNTCSSLVGKECTADSGLEPDHLKVSHDTTTNSDLLRYAEKQQSTKLRSHVHGRSDNYQRSELPKYSHITKRKNKVMVDKSTEHEIPGAVSSKTDSTLDKNEVEQNIEENLWSFEEAMRNLIRVNRKTAKLLKSSYVFSSKPNRVENPVDKACCSSKLGENVQKPTRKRSTAEKCVTKNVTASDRSPTKTDPSLTTNNQHLSENLEKILSNFSQQFSECQENPTILNVPVPAGEPTVQTQNTLDELDEI